MKRHAGILILLAIAPAAWGGEREGRTAGGETFAGRLIEIAEDGAAAFETADGRRRATLEELVDWGRLSDTADGTQVLLTDGGVIVAAGVRMKEDDLLVEARLFGKPEGFSIAGTSRLPLSAVRAIVFRVPLAAGARDHLFKKLFTTSAREDQLLLANGDVLGGTFARLAPAETLQGRPGPLAVTINTQAGAVEIRPDRSHGRLLEKVEAMLFNPLLARPARTQGLHAVVGFGDGSRLFVKTIRPSDGEQAELELVCGARITSHPYLNVWEEIAYLQPQGGPVRYLSDLRPAEGSYQHTPLLDLAWPLGVDENVLGGRLRAGGRLYLRGLGMHASSRVAYALDKPYKRLEAELVIDESAGQLGSVTFVVAADVAVTDAGRAFKVVYESPIVRGGEPPLRMAVDIAGARRIVLAVKSADRGTEMDRANWLNVRLME